MAPTETLREESENKIKQNIQELWDKIKYSNILVVGITEIGEWGKNIWGDNGWKYSKLNTPKHKSQMIREYEDTTI